MTGSTNEESGWLGTVGQVAGLLGLAVALVYLLGGIVTWVRLALFSFGNTVSLNVIPQLPRELVISTGLSSIVLWTVLVGVGYFVWRLVVRGGSTAPSAEEFAESSGNDRIRVFGLAAVTGVVTGGVTLLLLLLQRAGENATPSWWPWILIPLALAVAAGAGIYWLDRDGDRPGVWGLLTTAGVFLIGVAVILFLRSSQGDEGPETSATFILSISGAFAVAGSMIVTLDLRAKLASKQRHSWGKPAVIAAAAAIWVIPVVPAATVIAATFPLPEAHVCAVAGYGKAGVLIGESADEVFLGENLTREAKDAGQAPRIATFPMGRVEQLFIGPDAAGAECDQPPPSENPKESAQDEVDQPVPTPVPAGDEP